LILEASTIIFPRWGFPDWTIDLVLYLLIFGALVNVIIAWFYDITPEGFQKTKPFEKASDEDKVPDSRGWKAATYISLLVIVGLILLNVLGGSKELKTGDIQSLLVLPFDNFTGDDELDYVAAGMHSSLIGDIGQISGLRVISKTTANMYKTMNLSLPEIAVQSNTQAVVEPTVMCYGDSICIQVRVIIPFPEEKQLWVGEFKEEKSQVLNLYNQITKQIAGEIKVSLTPREEASLAQSKTVNTEAYDLYLKGQYYYDQLTPQALQMALEYFNKAIEIDPDWALPYAGITEYWGGIRQMGLAPSSVTIPNLYKYLNKTIELDPESAYTHYLSAMASVLIANEWENGKTEFFQALELNPNDARCRAFYAHLLLFLKKHDEALNQALHALELDPLNPLIQALTAVVHFHIGEYENAIELANHTTQLVPNHPLALNVLWGANELLGNYDAALPYCIRIFALDEQNAAMVMSTFDKSGYIAAMKKFISIVEAIPDDQILLSAGIRIAHMCVYAGETDKALSILERVLEEQGPDLPYVTTGIAHYKELENEPRFQAIVEHLGLPPPLPL
jgi:TolB-like protein